VKTIRFGRTNVSVPLVSLGTWGHGGERVTADGSSVGWAGHDDAAAKQAILTAWRNGISHWDTADVYGDGQAERLIGSMWGEVPREEIFLATKVGWDRGEYPHFYHPNLIRERTERSLKNLRTDVIDLHYFHHCDFGEKGEYFDDALEAMQKLREQGKFRFLGLSDWDGSKIMRYIDRVQPDVVQPYRNVVDDDYVTSGLRDWVDRNDLGVAFFSPIKHGLLLGKYDEPVEFPEGDFRSNVPEFRDAAALARMKRASAALRERFADWEEPVLGPLIGALRSDSPTSTVLLGQRTPRQAEAAARVGGAISREEADWVRQQYR
jgi:aryl-alcohol dehydrogenase-like predicted oxidoreductase